MPITEFIEVKALTLDLKNFRTVPQKNEKAAIRAMISIKPDRFYGVMDSLIQDGYLPTENIIVLRNGKKDIVKEGNRRIAALKLILGMYNPAEFALTGSQLESIPLLRAQWKTENSKVPCTVFSIAETELADKVVTLAHGKGEKASRDPWSSVARARHNRDVKMMTEHGLDLLEKYIKLGMNINKQQQERWSGDYSLTVLDDALRKIYPPLGFKNPSELIKAYPVIPKRNELEAILLAIGNEECKFETVRNKEFPATYGINVPEAPSTSGSGSGEGQGESPASPDPGATGSGTPGPTSSPPTGSGAGASRSTSGGGTGNGVSAGPAYASNDPKYVASKLKKFNPIGENRQKVVLLREEIKKLKIKENPLAFCFVLRSMFEISAKAYCKDHSISMTHSGGGKEKTLHQILEGVYNHLTNNSSNIPMVKVLHGASVELGKKNGILSVTSLNQLIHNPDFLVTSSDICSMFSNIYPLLEAMN